MSYQSPTIADIIHWIQTIEDPSPALADLATELSKNPNPEYSFRAHLFHELKSKHGKAQKPLFSKDQYSSIPFPVAYTLGQVNEHSYSELVQLLFLFDAIEIWVRWLVNVYAGVVLFENKQNLPTQLAGLINDQIKRPAFGSWLTILDQLHKAVRNSKLRKLKIPFDNIRPLISIRNSIAHGNIAGDLSKDKGEAIEHVKKIIKALKPISALSFFAICGQEKYSFMGSDLERSESATQEDGIYCVIGEHTIPLTILFRCIEGENADPLVLSYFSSKGALKKESDGSILEYVEINGGNIDHNEDPELLKAFIALFQTDQKISSDHPWQETLKKTKSMPSEAWEFEHELIKAWIRVREEQTEQKKAHILWFGGDVQTGKTTVLTSSLHRLNQNERLFFLYSFPSSKTFGSGLDTSEYIQQQLDRFFRQFRNAIVFWSQQHIKTEEINHTLSGVELLEDCTERIHRLLDLENITPYKLMIGLDDVHNLSVDSSDDSYAGCIRLREALNGLYIKKTRSYKRGKDSFEERTLVHVLFFLTGRSTKSQNDIDAVFSTSPSVDRLFAPQTYEELLPHMRRVDQHRYEEIQECQIKYRTQEERGAHLVPLEKSGAIAILTKPKSNAGLLSVFQAHHAHPFLSNVLSNAHGKPLYVHSIAEKLESDEITIDSDLSQISPLSAYFRTRMEEEFISDDRRILAFLICLLHHYDRLGIPLTLSSLQMLYDQDLVPKPANEEAIFRAIHSAPGLLKSVPLSRKNNDGTLQYAWMLASKEIAENIKENKELSHTRIEVQERILWFQKNHKRIPEGVELKEVFTPKNNNTSPFLETFRDLRNTLHNSILLHEPAPNTKPLFRKLQNSLLRLCSSWNAQKSWLQRCYEFDKNHPAHKEAVQFLEDNTSWNEVWIKQVNAPHLPIFDHEKGGGLLHERADEIIPLSQGYFLVMHSTGTATKPIFSSVSLCHLEHNQPLHIFRHDDPVAACVSWRADGPVLVYATTQQLYVYSLILQEGDPLVGEPSLYAYDGICAIVTLPNGNIAIAGKKENESGQWQAEEVDIQNQTCQNTWAYAPSGRSKPLYLFLTTDSWVFHVGANLIRCPFDGSPARTEKNPTGAPKSILSVYDHNQNQVGMISTKGTAKAKTSSARLDQEPSLALQEPKKTTSKPVAVFAYLEDLLIVTYDGDISLFHRDISLNIRDVLTKNSSYESIVGEDALDLRGAVLHQNELIVYGKKSLLFSITLGDGDISSWKLHCWPQLHYGKGAISDARIITENCSNFPSPFLITQSDDNDLRIWDVKNRVCLGLFRSHMNKLGTCTVMEGHLVSVDTDKNMRIWELNDSAVVQYKSMSQKQSPYISRVSCLDNNVFVLNQDGETSIWPDQGAGWSQAASKEPEVQQSNKSFRSIKQSLSLSKSLVCNLDNRLHFFLLANNTHIDRSVMTHPNTGKEVKWEIKTLHSTGSDEVLVVGSTKSTDKKSKEPPCYFVALFDAQGEQREYLECEYPCTVAAYVDSEQFLVVQEDGQNKTLSLLRWDGKPPSVPMEKTFVSGASVTGIYRSPSKEKILLWNHSSGKITRFYYVCEGTLYENFFNPNCTHAPSNIVETQQGLVFTEKDAQRWSLSLQMKEEVLSPQLDACSSEMFATENFPLVYEQLSVHRPYQCSVRHRVFAESEPYGVNVYYHSQGKTEKVTWMGLMMRNYTVGGIFDEGRVVAYKNREVIVLQVMRGNKEISFAELCSS